MMIEITKNVSLKPYNTFAVNVKTNFFVVIRHENEIYDLISTDIFTTQSHLILGGGANILFTKDYQGLIIKISIKGKKVIKEEKNNVYIKVGAGENWHNFVLWTLNKGYVGAENLVLIPGSVGAAPVGNIGAYGKEVKEIIYEVEGIDLKTGQKKIRKNKECNFTYRDSIFKNELKNTIIITSVTFILQKDHQGYIPNIQYHDIQDIINKEGKNPLTLSAQDVAHIIMEIRKKKLPDWKKVGTAGSFFKNPIIPKEHYEKLLLKYSNLKGNEVHTPGINGNAFKLSAGQLIELAGYKGISVGAVGTYDNHALIIVNNGGATGAEIWAFAQSIQKKVQEMFDITLEPEVIII